MYIDRHPVKNSADSVELNCFSLMNEDMDYSFIVPASHADIATAALLAGDSAWWADEGTGEWWGIPHPECLEMRLQEAGVPYEIRYNGADGRKENEYA